MAPSSVTIVKTIHQVSLTLTLNTGYPKYLMAAPRLSTIALSDFPNLTSFDFNSKPRTSGSHARKFSIFVAISTNALDPHNFPLASAVDAAKRTKSSDFDSWAGHNLPPKYLLNNALQTSVNNEVPSGRGSSSTRGRYPSKKQEHCLLYSQAPT